MWVSIESQSHAYFLEIGLHVWRHASVRQFVHYQWITKVSIWKKAEKILSRSKSKQSWLTYVGNQNIAQKWRKTNKKTIRQHKKKLTKSDKNKNC